MDKAELRCRAWPRRLILAAATKYRHCRSPTVLHAGIGLDFMKMMNDSRTPSSSPAVRLAALARDLRRQAPRRASAPLGPIPAVAARAVDKCRAELVGQAGAYHYNCPLDRGFFEFAGIDA